MSRNRLEAFSDGVIAILITIMVLELDVPKGSNWASLVPLVPTLLAYVLSFVYLAIYWNNHHHLFFLVQRVNGKVLWANLHLLFWLSLIPFTTNWLGEGNLEEIPIFAYGFVLSMAALAYYILEVTIISAQGKNSVLKEALGRDLKAKSSIVLYLAALPLSFYVQWAAIGIYVLVALMWLVPDKRIESKVV